MHLVLETGLLHQALDIGYLLRKGDILGADLVVHISPGWFRMRKYWCEGLTGINEKSAIQFAGVARAGFVKAMVMLLLMCLQNHVYCQHALRIWF